MKNLLCVVIVLLNSLYGFCQGSAKEEGYQVQLQIKPYQNQWVYLAYHYGSIKGLADSAFLNAESKGVLKAKQPLPQGIYIMASPSKSILFELLIPEDQHFSIVADTLNMQGSLKFEGSSQNDDFIAYTAFINPLGQRAEALRRQVNDSAFTGDKRAIQDEINSIGKQIADYRSNYIQKAPESLMATIFRSMQETSLPESLQKPSTRSDSLAQYRYLKDHYWDGVDFMDGRLVRTPILEARLKTYLESWVSPEPDSIIYEFNWMIALGRNDPEMFKYLIGYYIDHYMYPRIMGQDKVFLHVFERYIAGDKPKADWLNDRQLKIIRERAYNLMANQLGNPAWDMELVDTAGKVKTLYAVKSDFTVVAFWDVHCGKCREEVPRMDTLYRIRWKNWGVQVYAVMVNESSLNEWPSFIREHAAGGWVHVHQTEAMRTAEEKAGKPNFRQLYDMRSTPTLFLLDKDKKIIAKNVGLDDLDRLLQVKATQKSNP